MNPAGRKTVKQESEQQHVLFRVVAEEVGPDEFRISVNGERFGPAVDEAAANAIIPWFVGYLEQRVRNELDAMVGPTDPAVVSTGYESLDPSDGNS